MKKHNIHNTFVNCFKIAKKNKGVLFFNHWTLKYYYSTCRDLAGSVVADFRDGKKYGKKLSDKDRHDFYNLHPTYFTIENDNNRLDGGDQPAQ